MTNTRPSDGADDISPDALSRDLEAWKHFASTGAIDKNTMITVVSWLLGVGTAPVGYIVTQLITSFVPPKFKEPGQVILLSGMGMLISGIAGYVTLLYGGYANRNWAKAEYFARKRNWRDLLSETDPRYQNHVTREDRRGLARIAWTFARHHDPDTELPPVFLAYSLLALVMFVTSGAFLTLAGPVRLLLR